MTVFIKKHGMNDTTLAAEKKFQGLLMRRSAEERLAMGCSMFDASKQIVISSLKESLREIPLGDLKKEIFLRFYGHEFDDNQKKKILKALSAEGEK